MAFQTKYRIPFKDYTDAQCYIYIQYDPWAGAVTDLQPGPIPVMLEYHATAKYQPIVGSSLTMQCQWTAAMEEIFAEDDQVVRVQLVQDATYIWHGFITPFQYYRQFNRESYIVTFKAMDQLGALKNIKYEDAGDPIAGPQTEIAAIADILAFTGQQHSIYDMINIYDHNFTETAADSPLLQTYFYADMYYDYDNSVSGDCYTVLYDILKKYGARIFQGNDSQTWYMQRPNGLLREQVRRSFLYTGAYSSNTTPEHTLDADSWEFIGLDAELTRDMAIGRAEVTQIPPRRGNIIKNGLFRSFTWDGTDYLYWTRSGTPHLYNDNEMLKMGSNVAVAGALPTEYIECSVSLHNPTDITIDFDWTPTYTGSPSYKNLIIQIYDSAEYLVGSVKSGTPAWQAGAGYISIAAGTTGEEEHITLTIPETVTGGGFARGMSLRIRIYEFHNENSYGSDYFHMNNLQLSVASTAAETKVHTADNAADINYIKQEQIEVGDSWRTDYFPSTNIDDEFWVNTYSSSYLNTGEWFIKGDAVSEAAQVPIGELLAQQIVDGGHRATDTLRATFFIGDDLPQYWKAIKLSAMTDSVGFAKTFMPLGVKYNIARCTVEGEFIEIPATYNDTENEWDEEDFESATITGNSIEINNSVGDDYANFEGYTAVSGELLRIVITLTDDGSSDLPEMQMDGDALTVAWGANYIDYVCDSDGSKVLSIGNGITGDNYNLTCEVDLYYITGI